MNTTRSKQKSSAADTDAAARVDLLDTSPVGLLDLRPILGVEDQDQELPEHGSEQTSSESIDFSTLFSERSESQISEKSKSQTSDTSKPQNIAAQEQEEQTPNSELSSEPTPDLSPSHLSLVSSKTEKRQSGLRCEGIVKYWGKRQVLRGVDLQLGHGEIVGLLGPNGAGKTSLFQILIGLIRPDKGRVLLNGLDVSMAPMYRRARLGIGYLPQNSSIFRGMTVEQNLLAVLEISEPIARKRTERARELLDEFGIQHLRDAEASTLSGGESRRLEIARSLASNPDFILLDEPFAGIDPISIGEVKELIFGLKARGIGILVTDHNVRDTLGLVDRGYIFFEGKILNEGNPEDLASSEDVQRVYLGRQFNL